MSMPAGRNGATGALSARLRLEMVEKQIRARGIHSAAILSAMQVVPREEFLPIESRGLAYKDQPVPIGHGQTISQPYIVALMLELLGLKSTDTVLEVGVGSGYAIAIISRIVTRVYGIEWHADLAIHACERIQKLGYENVVVQQGDGSQGLPEKAPFDAILVSAAGWSIPDVLRRQLKIGGKMVLPVGKKYDIQKLLCIQRVSKERFIEKEHGSVRFVPLVGSAGWDSRLAPQVKSNGTLPKLIHEVAIPFDDIYGDHLDGLIERIGESRIVLIGEATHGTSEFYTIRAAITQQLISRKGFTIVAIEGDWPDAYYINSDLQGNKEHRQEGFIPFGRFPIWMWRNAETARFLCWLKSYNSQIKEPEDRVLFAGLDIYSLHSSMTAVLRILEQIDVPLANKVRARYECLTPWEEEPSDYGRAVLSGIRKDCEEQVLSVLQELLEWRLQLNSNGHKKSDLMNLLQNARIVANAEEYYRSLYCSSTSSWNLRDQHMFDTLNQLLEGNGGTSRAVVWAHNSHIGIASATEMGKRGEFNLGQLCREAFKEKAYHIGFGLNGGVVAAASHWGGKLERKKIHPAISGSYENVFHESHVPRCFLPLREPARKEVCEELKESRLERAIGVIYRPERERSSHYFHAVLPEQFDEYVWFDTTKPVTPLPEVESHGAPDIFPFGL